MLWHTESLETIKIHHPWIREYLQRSLSLRENRFFFSTSISPPSIITRDTDELDFLENLAFTCSGPCTGPFLREIFPRYRARIRKILILYASSQDESYEGWSGYVKKQLTKRYFPWYKFWKINPFSHCKFRDIPHSPSINCDGNVTSGLLNIVIEAYEAN